LWDVWKVYYVTYEQMESLGDLKRQRVAARLSFDAAKAMMERLDAESDAASPVPWFGHSMHPTSKE
jgi:hypothetical protein